MTNPTALRIVGAALVRLLGLCLLIVNTGAHASARAYRIGWESNPPFQLKGADSRPTGFAVELVREAAQRRGIQLEWVERPSNSEDSLRRGLVDLWPLITILPERKTVLHITEPYMQHEHYIMVRQDSPYRRFEDLSRAAMSLNEMPITRRLLSQVLPYAKPDPQPTVAAAIQEVCNGSADGVLVDDFTAFFSILGGLHCGALRVIWLPSLSTKLGVGSTFQAADVADEIRDEISTMGRGNRLTELMNEWNYYSPQNLKDMNALLDADQVRRRLIRTIGVFAGLLALAFLGAAKIARQRNRIKSEIWVRERKETELRESERRFRELLEQAQLVAMMIDLNESISFCNDYTLNITGWKREEMIGFPATQFMETQGIRRLAEALEASPPGHSPLLECALLTRDGQRRTIQWTTMVLRDHNGGPIGFAGVGEDITELRRLRAQAASRESEERFHAIFQQAALGVAQFDLDGRVMLVNDCYCEILQMNREELIGAHFRQFTITDDVGRQEELMRQLLAGETPAFSMDKRYVRKDGTVAWGCLNMSLARDADNQSKYFVAMVEDVTLRKRAEAVLRESEERFRNMADTAPVMIWVASTDKSRTFFNKGWLDLTGRTMEQEVGDGWAEGVHAEDFEHCVATYHSAFEARKPFEMEYRLRSADGTYRWLRDEGVPRFGPDAEFAGYIGSCIDITDLKRSHEEAISRQKLESLGVLAGGIAHDFNNLLGSIMADAELVLDELEPASSAREGIVRISGVALRAAEIVRELLTYAGKEKTVSGPVDISAVVREMLELVKVSISKSAELRTDLPPNLPFIRGNAARIRQVLLNLVINASEAIGWEPGIITVSVSLGPGDYLRLVVSDTGCGMPKEVVAQIFDPFYTTKFAGRGLGLASVQGIVRGLGGTIQVTSTPGHGTRFEILFPCMDRPLPESVQIAEGDSFAESGGCGVLVVEDEETLRTPICRLLERNRFSVIEAADGTAALEQFHARHAKIDVVLIDMTLPGVPARDVVAEVRKSAPHIAIILTTAYSQEEAIAQLRDSEPVDFIQKPYQVGDLLRLIRRAHRAKSQIFRDATTIS